MKISLKILLLSAALFACTISAVSQNAYFTYMRANTSDYKYSGLKGETMSKSDLLRVYDLSVEGLGADYVVKSFKASVQVGYNMVERSSNSNKFTDAQRNDIFKNAKTGSKIYIDDIVVAGADGTRKKISPLVITVAAVSQNEFIPVTYFTYADSTGAVQKYQCEEGGIPRNVLMNAVELCCDAGEGITSFIVSAKIPGYYTEEKSSSNKFNDAIRNNIFAKAPSGTKIYFDDIKDKAGKPLSVIVIMVK